MMDATVPMTAEDEALDIPSMTSTLTPAASSLQRLDDKLATGMSITDVARARWLTSVEALQYLDQASSDNLRKDPPASPPATGTLLLYNSAQTPDYANDGIEWVIDQEAKWKSIERVLASCSGSHSDSDSTTEASGGLGTGRGEGYGGEGGSQVGVKGSSSGSSSAQNTGASAEYLSCATRTTFHRREYRATNNIVLLHYLDSVKALRMTSNLVDRIVLLSANAGLGKPPPVLGQLSASRSSSSATVLDPKFSRDHTPRASENTNLKDTMNILMGMVDEHDAPGTSTAVAVDEDVLKSVNQAAFASVMKHLAPNEARDVVDSMDTAMQESLGSGSGASGDDLIVSSDDLGDLAAIGGIEDVTAVDIDEAIDQVLAGGVAVPGEDEDEANGSSRVSSSGDEEGSRHTRGAAEVIEDRILGSLDEVLPEELRIKLISTAEVMLDAAGVTLSSKKGEKKKCVAPDVPGMHIVGSPIIGSSPGPPGTVTEILGHALPEIIDLTPDVHVMGYQPTRAVDGRTRGKNKIHEHHVIISMATQVPGLPPYVDQYHVWERYAAFVDFQDVADDAQVRSVSFNRLTALTPYSFKVKMPTDIMRYSVRHVVLVGVLLPKDHRVERNLLGIELALKLTLQTEWAAAADLVGAFASEKYIKGIKKPVFIAPCGGMRMQLLSQIGDTRFTSYPAPSLQTTLANALNPYGMAPNFVQRVAITAQRRGGTSTHVGIEKNMEIKRKRENYLEEWAATSGINVNMTTAEVDRHRKVRFVERMSNAIVDTKGEDEVLSTSALKGMGDAGIVTTLDGMPVEDMPEEEVDELLGRVLLRYVEVCIGRCSTREELLREINWCGYAGLTLLHHACFYSFMELVTVLLNNGADINIQTSEGDLTPLHFAAGAGHRDVVDVLIRHGCNPIPLDSNGDTPTDHARMAGHVEIAAMLGAYQDQAGLTARSVETTDPAMASNPPSKTTDTFLQSAFKELSLKDKLGLNLFVDRSKAAPVAYVHKEMSAWNVMSGMETETGISLGGESARAFSFISQEDRARLREAMLLANEIDLQEMNLRAEHQDVRRFLRQSNFEAISAASQALEKSNQKEASFLTKASEALDDPSKMQLSRALAMLVLRKNLPTA